MYFLLFFYAVLAIGFSFFCSVAEAVLLSVSPSYIATLKEKGKRSAARLEHLKANVDRPLAAILSLNTIAHTVGAAGVGAQAAVIWPGEESRSVGLASAVMTLLILILSEIIPKTIGAVYWRTLAPMMSQLIQILIWLLYPLVLLSELLTRLIGGNRTEVVTREEVAAMASLSARGGELDAGESKILKNLFRLRSLTAVDIMTPRTVIVAFPQQTTVEEVLSGPNRLTVSRIPIYDGDIDKVTGFVLKTDILLAQAEARPNIPLKELRRELSAVPGSTNLSRLFELLMDNREHLALVVDEYGGTDGLVTLEDLIETLLGAEIVDEADSAPDMQRLARQQWSRRAQALGLDIDKAAGEEQRGDQTSR